VFICSRSHYLSSHTDGRKPAEMLLRGHIFHTPPLTACAAPRPTHAPQASSRQVALYSPHALPPSRAVVVGVATARLRCRRCPAAASAATPQHRRQAFVPAQRQRRRQIALGRFHVVLSLELRVAAQLQRLGSLRRSVRPTREFQRGLVLAACLLSGVVCVR
jgi:hypothetical protein